MVAEQKNQERKDKMDSTLRVGANAEALAPTQSVGGVVGDVLGLCANLHHLHYLPHITEVCAVCRVDGTHSRVGGTWTVLPISSMQCDDLGRVRPRGANLHFLAVSSWVVRLPSFI
jgi:hypothetical protein